MKHQRMEPVNYLTKKGKCTMLRDDLYLIPTAEVPVTNMFRDVILAENELPVLTGLHCFVVKRVPMEHMYVNRLQQFDKVEIVRVEHPDNSYKALDGMVEHIKKF
jgi:seryl-tRNA synthetase